MSNILLTNGQSSAIERSSGQIPLVMRRNVFGGCTDCIYDPAFEQEKMGITCNCDTKCENGNKWTGKNYKGENVDSYGTKIVCE